MAAPKASISTEKKLETQVELEKFRFITFTEGNILERHEASLKD